MNDSARDRCLTEDDFYAYLTSQSGRSSELDQHLSFCERCREELASLVDLLQGDAQETVPEPSAREVEATLALIERASASPVRVAAPARMKARPASALRSWMPIAAALLLGVGLGVVSLQSIVERSRSSAFFDQGRSALGEVYAPQSPNGLRLDLPFESSASERGSAPTEALRRAENLFFQALAVREGMDDARLGLAYVYMKESKFAQAEAEFRKVLQRRADDPRALLGRGAVQYESALASLDPLERTARLKGALADFDGVLVSRPQSAEARYNRTLALFELGRHDDALAEIRRYLERDADSIWAERMRALESRIRLNRAEAVDQEILRAGVSRDAAAIDAVARLAAHQMPKAIRNALVARLALDGTPASEGRREALLWAAARGSEAYARVTGDGSYGRLLEFYAGLSPPQHRQKRALDARLDGLIEQHKDTPAFDTILQETATIQKGFEQLRDDWRLVDLHHLRGNCVYYGQSNFPAALREYEAMLRAAERTGAADLVARATAALASAYIQTRSFDAAIPLLDRTRDLAARFRLDRWSAFAARNYGYVYLSLNQLDRSMQSYAEALGIGYRILDEEIIMEALPMLAEAKEQRGLLSEARELYRLTLDSQESFLRSGSIQASKALQKQRLKLLYREGALALAAGDLPAAEARFQSNLGLPFDGLHDLEARNLLGLAQIHVQQRNFEAAGRDIRAAGPMLAAGNYPELEWESAYLEGRLLGEQGKVTAALRQLDRAIGIVEHIRENVPSLELRRSFMERRFEPYKQAVSLLYHSSKPERALDYVDRAKAITLREHLRVARDGGAILRPLPRGVVAVEYFVTPQELLLFVSDGAGTAARSRPVPAAELQQRVGRFVGAIRNSDAASFDREARSLHDDLIAPVADRLRAGDTLVVLPDGPLHELPFAGLKDAAGRFVIDRHAVAFAPSRSVFDRALALGRERLGTGPILLLDGGAALSGASQEIADVARLYRGRSALSTAADLSALPQLAAGAEIIHFAGHAVASGGRPALLVQTREGEARLDAPAIDRWKLPRTGLVVLAGCSTAIGPRAEGEAPWGLLPAFLNAGAPSIVATLLPVEDAAGRRLTSRFYELIARGPIARAEALREAQLRLRAENSPPRSWVPFVLIGDPR